MTISLGIQGSTEQQSLTTSTELIINSTDANDKRRSFGHLDKQSAREESVWFVWRETLPNKPELFKGAKHGQGTPIHSDLSEFPKGFQPRPLPKTKGFLKETRQTEIRGEVLRGEIDG